MGNIHRDRKPARSYSNMQPLERKIIDLANAKKLLKRFDISSLAQISQAYDRALTLVQGSHLTKKQALDSSLKMYGLDESLTPYQCYLVYSMFNGDLRSVLQRQNRTIDNQIRKIDDERRMEDWESRNSLVHTSEQYLREYEEQLANLDK